MILNRRFERYKAGDCITLTPIGDIHLGSANCDKPLLTRTIKEIADDPNARWLGMGDYAEFITPKDPRWHAGGIDREIIDIGQVDEIGDLMVDYLADLFRPIIGKCWGMGRGNHEVSYEQHNGTNIMARLLREFKAPDLDTGWACLTNIGFADSGNHKNGWTIYHAHGWQAGRTKGAKVNEAEKMVARFEADIHLHGHSHDRWIIPVATRLRANHTHDKLIAEDKYAGHTGCFLRTYQEGVTGYGERAEYPSTSLGTIKIKFYPNRGENGNRKRVEVVQ